MPKRVRATLPSLERGQTVWVYGKHIDQIKKDQSGMHNHGKVDSIFVGEIVKEQAQDFVHDDMSVTTEYFIFFRNSGYSFATYVQHKHILVYNPTLPNNTISAPPAPLLSDRVWELQSLRFIARP